MTSQPCRNYKSTLVDTIITISSSGSSFDNDDEFNGMDRVPIQVTIKAYELSYGPVIDYDIKVSVPYTNPMDWDDHPFMYLKQDNAQEKRTTSGNIIDDTPAVRAILQELVKAEPFKLYTTTDCTHRARLIAALDSFWS